MTLPKHSIDINSITLRFGIGCFETLKINEKGLICFLHEHLERLKLGIKTCNLNCPSDQEINTQLTEFINKQNLQKQKNYILRLIFTAEYGLDLSLNEYIENKNPSKLTISQNWLKKIIQAEIIARCLKNFFRFDMQNSVFLNMDKSAKK